MLNLYDRYFSSLITDLDDVLSLKHRVVLGVVMLLGLGLRLYSVYAGEGFHYFAINDEVSAYQFTLAFLAGEPYAQYLSQPVFAGAQVPGPLWTLYGVLLYTLGGESASNAIFVSAIINSLVVFLVYKLAGYFLSGSDSLLTALLFAVLPWPLYHAAGFWNPAVLALFGSLLFIAMWRVCLEAGSKYIFFVCLLLAAIPQFHMIGIFYIPVAGLLLILLSPGLNWRWLMFGIVAGCCLYLPYLFGEMQNGWSNTQMLFSADTGFSWGWLKILSAPATLLSSVPGSVTTDDKQAITELGDGYFGSHFVLLTLSIVTLLTAFIFYLGYLKVFVGAAVAVMKREHAAIAANRPTLFVGGMIFLPLTFFALTGHSYASRYALLIMPLLFLLPAIMVRRMSSVRIKQLFPVAVVLLAIYCSYLAAVTYHYKATLLNDSALLMPSFKKLERISSLVNEDAGTRMRATLSLSPSIEGQKGKYHKMYTVYPLYVEIDQLYKYAKAGSVLPIRHYLVHLPDEAEPPQARIIYRDQSVVVTTLEKVKS